MNITLIAIGKKMPSWVDEAFELYRRRLKQDVVLKLKALEAPKRSKNSDTARLIEQEGEAMLAACGKGNRRVCLDVKGQAWSTEELAQQMQNWQLDGRHVDLLVGGAEGLSPGCLSSADQTWSLSPLTLPHPMVRVLLAETLYRSWSLNNNHPYHRE